jgi:hypothetical protein
MRSRCRVRTSDEKREISMGELFRENRWLAPALAGTFAVVVLILAL